MLKTLELRKIFINPSISTLKNYKIYKKLSKQREKNTRFGNYKRLTHSTTFRSYRRKEMQLYKKICYRLKKKICFCYRNNLINKNINKLYFDEVIFYENTELFEIKNIRSYVFFLKKLLKMLSIFLISSKIIKLYSDLDFLRYFLNRQVKIFPILKTNLSNDFQKISSKNIKNFKNINIIPTVVSTILTDKEVSAIKNEREYIEKY
jgi:ribosomal protein S18